MERPSLPKRPLPSRSRPVSQQVSIPRRCFQPARDDDALQFRTETRLNEIIRRFAAIQSVSGARLVDVEDFLARHSPQGVPGRELFYEHVHLTPEGNYLIARSLAEETAAALELNGRTPGPQTGRRSTASEVTSASVPAGGVDAEGGWLDRVSCLRELGFTEWNQYDCYSTMLTRILRPPFSGQSNHAPALEQFREVLRLDPGNAEARRLLDTTTGR